MITEGVSTGGLVPSPPTGGRGLQSREGLEVTHGGLREPMRDSRREQTSTPPQWG